MRCRSRSKVVCVGCGVLRYELKKEGLRGMCEKCAAGPSSGSSHPKVQSKHHGRGDREDAIEANGEAFRTFGTLVWTSPYRGPGRSHVSEKTEGEK